MGDWSIVAIVGILCFTWVVWWAMYLGFKDNAVTRPPAEQPPQVVETEDTMIHPSEQETGVWPSNPS